MGWVNPEIFYWWSARPRRGTHMWPKGIGPDRSGTDHRGVNPLRPRIARSDLHCAIGRTERHEVHRKCMVDWIYRRQSLQGFKPSNIGIEMVGVPAFSADAHLAEPHVASVHGTTQATRRRQIGIFFLYWHFRIANPGHGHCSYWCHFGTNKEEK